MVPEANMYAVDPQVLFSKLEMVVLDKLLDQRMDDDFEYFSLIGRGISSQSISTSELPTPTPRQKRSDISRRLAHRDLCKRRQSLPCTDHLLRVRNFETSGKFLLNRGDIVQRSNNSLASSQESVDSIHRSVCVSASASSIVSSDTDNKSTFKILLVGGEHVGKTSLTQQFLTSDDVHTDEYLDDGKEKSCSVLLDGAQSYLTFMDSDYDQDNYDPSSANAYIVVYSITDRHSFTEANQLLSNLRRFEKTKAIILCGNKSDLARRRKVSLEEGKQLAADHSANFIETSTMLNHKVDHLLVGILRQIKEQLHKSEKASKKPSRFKKSIKHIVGKLVRSKSLKAKPTSDCVSNEIP